MPACQCIMITSFPSGRALLLALIVAAVTPSIHAGVAERSRHRDTHAAGNTYVITGASHGFGRGVAVTLGKRHANVVLSGERADLLQRVAREVRSAGGNALVVAGDVSSPADMNRLRHAAVRRFGRIDAWINTVGADVEMKNLTFSSRAALRQFRTQGYGTLVIVGASDRKVPLAYQTEYSEIRARVSGFGRGLNAELRREGLNRTIRVATVMPEVVDPPRRDYPCYTGALPWTAEIEGSPRTVNVIIAAADRPREEIPNPGAGIGAFAFNELAPDFVPIVVDAVRDNRHAQECFGSQWRSSGPRH